MPENLSHKNLDLTHCILCNDKATEESPLTHEHIFAEWSLKALEIEKLSPQSFLKLANGETSIINPGRDGIELKVLCNTCNNDWGSRLQQKSGEVLKPLLKGKWSSLNLKDRSQIARWLTCFCMVREFYHPELLVTTQEVRKAFREDSNKIPHGYYMWAAAYKSGNALPQSWHRGMKDRMTHIPFGHLTLCTLGKIAFFTIYISKEFTNFINDPEYQKVNEHLRLKGFSPIHPFTGTFPQKPPKYFNEHGYQFLIENISNILNLTWDQIDTV